MNSQSSNKKNISILGVPSDLGANIRGANIGPSALRIAGLNQKIQSLGYDVSDYGDITVPVRESLPEEELKSHYLKAITSICKTLSETYVHLLEKKSMPITLGGDHSIVIGSISGASVFSKKNTSKDIGLIWVDAHADINTPASSPSGNIHGMPLQILLGNGPQELCEIQSSEPKINPEKTVLIGIRNIDGEEKKLLKSSGIRYYTMREIDEKGMFKVMEDAIAIASKDSSGIHLSFDLDAVDPLYAPGVSTPETGGLSYREAHLALEMLADTKKLCSMDFVELNPATDVGHKTADLTVGLILSALGKSIV